VSQTTSRCENTVNTNIKRLTPPHSAKTTLEKGLAAFKQIFSARKPRSLLSPAHRKAPRSRGGTGHLSRQTRSKRYAVLETVQPWIRGNETGWKGRCFPKKTRSLNNNSHLKPALQKACDYLDKVSRATTYFLLESVSFRNGS